MRSPTDQKLAFCWSTGLPHQSLVGVVCGVVGVGVGGGRGEMDEWWVGKWGKEGMKRFVAVIVTKVHPNRQGCCYYYEDMSVNE